MLIPSGNDKEIPYGGRIQGIKRGATGGARAASCGKKPYASKDGCTPGCCYLTWEAGPGKREEDSSGRSGPPRALVRTPHPGPRPGLDLLSYCFESFSIYRIKYFINVSIEGLQNLLCVNFYMDKIFL